MSREGRERLTDILGAIEAIRTHTASLDATPADVVRDAILYRLVVLGEAVKAIPEATRARQPDIDWPGIAGLRDIITHEYFRIDAERIDELIGEPLDVLERAVHELLAAEGER